VNFKRHEIKYYISAMQAEVLQKRLAAVMGFDTHSQGHKGYIVRSLYFDSIEDECLYQKQSGINRRKKVRLRTYGRDQDGIVKFEIKYKNGLLVNKYSARLEKEDAIDICGGDYSRLLDLDNPVFKEIYRTFQLKRYTPRVIVEYRRVAFTFPVSNIRVTVDKSLRSYLNHLDLFSSARASAPVILEGKQILEVKYDRFIPAHLKKVLSMARAERMAISKYTLARRFSKLHKWEDN